MKDLTGELLTALLAAPADRKERALQTLRGEIHPENMTQAVSGPLLLGMSASAKLLGVSRPTLWRMIRAGRLQKVEILSGSFRIRRTDLEALGHGNLKSTAPRGAR